MHVTFMCAMVTCKCGKAISIAVLQSILFSNCLKNHVGAKTFLQYMGVFVKFQFAQFEGQWKHCLCVTARYDGVLVPR